MGELSSKRRRRVLVVAVHYVALGLIYHLSNVGVGTRILVRTYLSRLTGEWVGRRINVVLSARDILQSRLLRLLTWVISRSSSLC